ncbi:MAG: aspartate 1-decarboxylase [Verrucomicrobiales bacterium]|jgi:aspartate 1-decarboxylase|nr:aspartate 1-decarboxylase [Verrucomicrobiales bacterium]MDA7681724.1 aspartate 1-decarboxylase [Verrucomicrobiales bacterium]|tara:strand:- start:211 stop:558 length:348 start_codon:yes stop_codon:yes gene_type:complete
MRQVLRSKIHRATVTEANPDYVGSITIDQELMESVGLWPGEKVLVASVDTGQRLETYTLKGDSGSGVICLNGAAAKLIKKGEIVIIIGFEITDKPVRSKTVIVNSDNKIEELIES